jgi:uncharacterized membrane protein
LFAAEPAKNLKRLAAGSGAGVFAALVLAALRRGTRLVNREQVSLAVLLAALAAAVLYIVVLWRRKKHGLLWDALGEWSGPALSALIIFYTLPTILLYPTEFLLPEQSLFSTDFLFKSFGFLFGIVAAALCAGALYNTGKELPTRIRGLFLSAALAVTMLSQLSVVLQFMLARRVIRPPRWVFTLVVKTINNHTVFLYCIMALTVALPVALFIRSFRPPLAYRNPAELRKIRAGKRTQRRWCAALAAGYLFSLVAVTAVKAYTERGVVLAPAEEMTIEGTEIVIPLSKIEDGRLHRYNYAAAESIEMRFIIIRKNETAYGVGLDACDICGPTGYYERKDGVICRLCDVVMNKTTIGLKGGCNPVPLSYALRAGAMVINTTDLEKERARFR